MRLVSAESELKVRDLQIGLIEKLLRINSIDLLKRLAYYLILDAKDIQDLDKILGNHSGGNPITKRDLLIDALEVEDAIESGNTIFNGRGGKRI